MIRIRLREDRNPPETRAMYAEWLRSRPECVQRLAVEFPAGCVIEVDGVSFYALGWTEDDSVIVSRIDGAVDYDEAMAAKEYICAKHLREGRDDQGG